MNHDTPSPPAPQLGFVTHPLALLAWPAAAALAARSPRPPRRRLVRRRRKVEP